MKDRIENPYVGLRPFESDESLLFFGRQQQTIDILHRLHKHRFVAVIGGSGSGKSSLIRAGVIPKLKAGFLLADSDRWHIAKMKPGRNPLYNLISSLVYDFQGENATKNQIESLLKETEEEGADRIVSFIKEHSKNAKNNVFLLVDQFEEIFRFSLQTDKHDDSLELVSILLELSNQTEIPIYIVLTMRSDFIGDCDQFIGLPKALNQSQYLVPKMDRQQLKSAIEGPAMLSGKGIDPLLLNKLLNDLNKVKDELPLLQHALMRMWEKSLKKGSKGFLNIEDYKAVGRLQNALSNHAQQAYDELKETDKKTAEIMFKALTTIDENGRKIRRPALLSNITSLSSRSKDEVLGVCQKFIEGKRSFLILQKTDHDDIIIDISHESLIRQWDTLRNWVDEESISSEIYLQIGKALEQKKNKERSYLDKVETARAKQWLVDNNPNKIWANSYNLPFDDVIDFIDESEAINLKEEKEKLAKTKRIQKLMAAVIGLLGLIVIVGAFLYYNKVKTDKENARKEKAKLIYFQGLSVQDKDPTIAYGLYKIADSIANDELYSKAATSLKKNSLYKNLAAITDYKFKEVDLYQPFSIDPSGNKIFVVDSLNNGLIIDNNGETLITLDQKDISSSTFNPSGTTLYYSRVENKLYRFDLDNKQSKLLLTLDNDEITSLEYNSDLSILIGTNKGFVYKTDIEGNIQDSRKFVDANVNSNRRSGAIRMISGSGNITDYALIDDEGRAYVSNTANQRQLSDKYRYSSIDMGADGSLVVGNNNGLIQTLTSNLQIKSFFKTSQSKIDYVSFLGGDNLILSGSEDGDIALWNMDGDLLQEFKGHKKAIFAHRLSKDGQYIFTYSNDGTFKRWKLKQAIAGIMTVTINIKNDDLNKKDLSLKLFQNNKLITNSITKNTIELIDIGSGGTTTLISSENSCADIINKFELSSDGEKILISCRNGHVNVYDSNTAAIIKALGDLGINKGISLSNNGNSAVVSTLFNVSVFPISNDSSTQKTINPENSISAMTPYNDDSNLILVATENSGVLKINIDSEEKEKILDTDTMNISVISLSKDNSKLTIGTTTGSLYVWDMVSKTYTLKLHKLYSSAVGDIQISTDLSSILSISKNGRANLHTIEGKAIEKIEDGDYRIIGVSFDQNDQQIFSLSSRGILRPWNIVNKTGFTIEDSDIESLSPSQKTEYGLDTP